MARTRQIDVPTQFTKLPDIPCISASILNTSGANLDVRFAHEDNEDQLITLPDGKSVELPVGENAEEIEVRGPAAATDGIQLVLK